MGDDARRALGPRGVAVCAGSRRAVRREDGRRTTDDRGRIRKNLYGRRKRKIYLSSVVCPPSSPRGTLRPIQILRRIDRRRAFADFEMKLRRRHVTGLAGMRDHLAAFHRLAALDQDVAGMSVGGDEAVIVA